MTLNIQETVTKYKKEIRELQRTMDSYGGFHPLNETADHQPCTLTRIPEIAQLLSEHTLTEFLGKLGTTAGSSYLIPDALYSQLIFKSQQTDLVPLMGYMVNGWKGGDLTVSIGQDHTYKASLYESGPVASTDTIETKKLTLSPKGFNISIRATQDLVDDTGTAPELVAWHIDKAALQLGKLATDLAINVLKTGTDGWGTVNSSATGDADETRLVNGTTADIGDAVIALGDDEFLANTMLITPSAWGHSVATQAAEVGWNYTAGTGGYSGRLGDLDVLKSTSPQLHASSDAEGAAFTNCVTVVFDRNNALLTGRKRWMRIENYVDPIRDIAGAVVSCRQDSVTLYNDSIYVLTET